MIETKRLILRKYSEEDIPALHQILSDPVTMSFWPKPFSIEQTAGWIERAMKSYNQNDFGRMGVILKETGELIGDCGIIFGSDIDGKNENDLGYIIDNKSCRRGFGFEAADAVQTYAFEKLNLSRLAAIMAFDNIASMRTAQKIGMQKEKEYYSKSNRNILTYLFSSKRIS